MIYLSAGHHNKDSGAAYGIYVERDLTKESRSLIELHLDSEQVIKDKDSETNVEYQKRIKPAGGSVVFDIHFNAAGATASGTECFVNAKDFKNKDSLSFKMAQEICDTTANVLGIKNRGVKSETQSQHKKLGILNKNAGCSVLWEICFISSISDMASYTRCKEDLSKAIASILKKYDALK